MSLSVATDHVPLHYLRVYFKTRGPVRCLPKALHSWQWEAIDANGRILAGRLPVEIREDCRTVTEAVVALAARFGTHIIPEVVRNGWDESTWHVDNKEFCDDCPY